MALRQDFLWVGAAGVRSCGERPGALPLSHRPGSGNRHPPAVGGGAGVAGGSNANFSDCGSYTGRALPRWGGNLRGSASDALAKGGDHRIPLQCAAGSGGISEHPGPRYIRIDPARVVEFLGKAPEAFRRFAVEIREWLARLPEDDW